MAAARSWRQWWTAREHRRTWVAIDRCGIIRGDREFSTHIPPPRWLTAGDSRYLTAETDFGLEFGASLDWRCQVTRNRDLSLMKPDAAWWPELEIVKLDRCLVARLALRGIAKDNLSVFVDDGGLVVEGERNREIEAKRGDQGTSEPTGARFRRPIPLTDGVSPEDVKTTFTAGVLELTSPPHQRPPHAIHARGRSRSDRIRAARASRESRSLESRLRWRLRTRSNRAPVLTGARPLDLGDAMRQASP